MNFQWTHLTPVDAIVILSLVVVPACLVAAWLVAVARMFTNSGPKKTTPRRRLPNRTRRFFWRRAARG